MGQRIWQNSKQSQTAYEDLRMKNLTLALVGIFINLRRQAIDNFFWKEIPSTLQGRAWLHSSNHTTLVNYLDSMWSLWGNMFTRTWKNARNKEYASLFMEAHGVHMANWHRLIEFNFSDQHAICLNSRVREFEGSVVQTIVWRGRRGSWGKSEVVWSNQRFGHPPLDSICPDLQRVGPSMMCNMLGERSRKSLQLVILRDLPHTYSCTCFYLKEKKGGNKKDSTDFEHRGV